MSPSLGMSAKGGTQTHQTPVTMGVGRNITSVEMLGRTLLGATQTALTVDGTRASPGSVESVINVSLSYQIV